MRCAYGGYAWIFTGTQSFADAEVAGFNHCMTGSGFLTSGFLLPHANLARTQAIRR